MGIQHGREKELQCIFYNIFRVKFWRSFTYMLKILIFLRNKSLNFWSSSRYYASLQWMPNFTSSIKVMHVSSSYILLFYFFAQRHGFGRLQNYKHVIDDSLIFLVKRIGFVILFFNWTLFNLNFVWQLVIYLFTFLFRYLEVLICVEMMDLEAVLACIERGR